MDPNLYHRFFFQLSRRGTEVSSSNFYLLECFITMAEVFILTITGVITNQVSPFLCRTRLHFAHQSLKVVDLDTLTAKNAYKNWQHSNICCTVGSPNSAIKSKLVPGSKQLSPPPRQVLKGSINNGEKTTTLLLNIISTPNQFFIKLFSSSK